MSKINDIYTKIESFSFYNLIKTFIDLIITKIFYKNTRIIRNPIYFRYKNRINFGNLLTTGRYCRLEAFGESNNEKIIFGDYVQIGDFVHISAIDKIEIGHNTLIASKVLIIDHDHGVYDETSNSSDPLSSPLDRKLASEPILVKNNVWIGESVTICKGVTIGKGSIIGANSLVLSDIPEYCIAVGSPAKVIKIYDFNKKVWIKK